MPQGKLPRERVPYSAIVDRPPLRLPGGARMAVWTIPVSGCCPCC